MATLKLSKSTPVKRDTKRDDVPSASFSRRARAGLPPKKPTGTGPSINAKSTEQQPERAKTAFVRGPAATAPAVTHPPNSVRLSKRMSELGLASRREADEWIERGWVRVDGIPVTELGSRVLPHQAVTIDKRATREQAARVTILLNKPVGYVSGQAEDGHQPAIKLLLPENHWTDDPVQRSFKREHLRNLAPAGRLDIDSVGLIVFTQDGRIAKELVGEGSEIEKEYLVRVRYTERGRLPADKLALLNDGLELDGVQLRPAKVSWQNEDQLRFVLREGRKRQIRRMCEAVGLEVLGLKRIRIGQVTLGRLPEGQWRYLGEGESF
jgi:23S rRNA pseudouridine2604 synthase